MLEYRQRTFQGAFHISNDYMHWYGWAPLNTAVNNILQEAERMRAEHKANSSTVKNPRQAALSGAGRLYFSEKRTVIQTQRSLIHLRMSRKL